MRLRSGRIPHHALTLRHAIAVAAATAVLASTGAAAAGNVQYIYDALGRVRTVTYSNGTVVTYAYDAAGNRTVVTTTAPAAPIWGAFTWGQANW